jgi:DNA-binding phage protein
MVQAEKGRMKMALTRDFNATVVARVKSDPTFAQALLDEALTLLLNGDPDTAKLILRDFVNATIGFESLAANLHKPSKSLHRMLSKSGNPTLAPAVAARRLCVLRSSVISGKKPGKERHRLTAG